MISLKYFKKKKLKLLVPILKPLVLKTKIKANHVTLFSFLSGLLAAYFLFDKHGWFILFGLLHIVFDFFDGVVAQITKPTRLGAHLDNGADRIIVLALLVKTYFYFLNPLILLFIGIYLIHHIIFILSGLRTKVIYCKSFIIITYMFKFYFLGYWAGGIVPALGIVLQMVDYLRKI